MTPLARQGLRDSIRGVAVNYLPGLKTCAEMDAMFVVYLDNELSGLERCLFNVHLRICRECREYLWAYWNSLLLAKLVLDESVEPLDRDQAESMIAAVIEELHR